MIQEMNEINSDVLKLVLENDNKKILIPLFDYNNIYYIKNNLVGLFIYDISSKEYFSFNFQSSDLKLFSTEDVLNNIHPRKTFIKNSQYFYKYWNDRINDVDVSLWYNNESIIQFDILYCTANPRDKHNSIYVPWIKFLESAFNYIIKLNSKFDLLDTTLYERVWNSVYNIDLNGINKNGEIIHTNYSTITKTGRPTSTFQGVNMLALSKLDDRIHIQPRPGNCLFEFDWESCHIRLIANLIQYSFDDVISIHEYFAKYYLKKETISEIEYVNSKALTFKYLYGDLNEDVHEFFKEVNKFKIELFKEYKLNSYILSPITKRKISGIENATPSKVLNYLVQAYETEIGLIRIKQINEYLPSNHKLILWTYDSFLFDIQMEPNINNIIIKLKSILEQDNMKVHIKYGLHNFSDMRILKLE